MNKNVIIIEHPLVHHKIALLRDRRTTTKEFREVVGELATLVGYEALHDLPLEPVEIKTPIETVNEMMIRDDSVAVIPILRSGLCMVDGILKLLPNAKVGHIGLYSDRDMERRVEYYTKLPKNMEGKQSIILDPIIATGESACSAIDIIKQSGCKHIKFVSLLASPAGLERIISKHPDVLIYLGAKERELDADCFLVPGVGDAGDRMFGTK
ncbi:MAG: uracil phosphoribosyltransferase [Christensenellaceae bacterium]|jgi:uracil phosphoribosyltransferase|nr:uracil phosphoribosyltransferase [Christensenellaceae bacterium]